MGTVGISFGSPTGGSGFDVSNTVSQIVANLSKVESPWQSQLSSLEAQDSAISSLGSLLASLSSDISNFTDFSGVLSTMDGSSSDTSIVALTSASSSAVAGTHTIVVNSLASTSSGSLTTITNSSDTMDSGSITITVGSGTAQTVNVDSGDTLSDVASAINNAGIGVTASVITDSNGSRLSLVSGTSGASGNLTVSSNLTDATTGTSLTYTSATSGADASLVVDGENVSVSSNTVSSVIPGVTFQLLSANSNETVQVEIVNDTSTVASALESFASDYNAVISAINTQESTDSSGNAEPLFGTPTLTLLQEQLLDSVNQTSSSGYFTAVTSSTDTLSGSISIKNAAGSTTTFDISSLSSTDQTLAGLAAAINAAGIGVTANVVNNSSGGAQLTVSSLYGGAPTVVSSLTDATTSSSLSYTSLGDVNSLSKLGFSVQDDGTLSLDTSSLTSELNSDYSGVLAFFQNSNSWGLDFSTTLNNLGTSSTTGLLSLALSANSSTESSLQTNISNENTTISAEQSSLTLELTSANEILQAIPSQLDEINKLYSSITGYNEKS